MALSATVLASEENVLVPHVGEVVIGLIAFGLLCFVLMKYVFPRIEQVYAERRDAIEGGLQRAADEQAKARAAYDQYTAQLAEAQSEAARFREEARADAARIRDEAHTEAQAEAARIQATAEAHLAAERAAIVSDLRREIGGLAVDLAEKLVGHQLSSDAEQQRLVDDFIADLDRQADQPAQAETAGQV
jgi:F-type H+-transporting ATPase subunit b